MHTQQVLDNLAMFVYAPGSFPSFSTFKQGTSQIQDTGSFNAPVTLSRFRPNLIFGLTQVGLNSSATRQAQEAWTIEPVNDPRKLELMRCAYQRSVAAYRLAESTSCPDCEKRFASFYTGDPNGDIANESLKRGVVTSECIGTGDCWFAVGCKKCAKRHDCDYIGHYCGVYVWVPEEGRDELAKLTIAILDYATQEPRKPVQQVKEVTWFLDSKGSPSKSSECSTVVKATVDIKDSNSTVLRAPVVAEIRAFLADRRISLDELTSLGPLGLYREKRLSDDEVRQLLQWLKAIGYKPQNEIDAKGDVQAWAEKAKTEPLPSTQLESLLRMPTPLFLPERRSTDGADDVLQLRQLLNTVTILPP